MPAGADETRPEPVPVGVTHNPTFVVGASAKVATQLEPFASTIWVLVEVPLQLPDQPPKVEPVAGTALKVTVEFPAKLNVQVLPQAMPEGVELMVPAPVPALLTTRLTLVVVGLLNEKLAAQVEFAASVT